MAKEERVNKSKEDMKDYEDEYVLSYVDTLLDLEVSEEKRKLKEEEMVSLCSEFLNAGTDTTSTALQWIMANLVKYPQTQEKLFMEMKGVVQDGEERIKEEELQKMPYLKAVILEGLRRHPPAHFVLPHAVTEDVVLANLIWKFEWKAVDGDDVDLSEKEEFTVVMKNPLQAQGCRS
ncbi:hypothetical protein OIU78_028417 [Salix suchowensis]|nr:hypothetical protein OIU78_028417 [Salix suchowensis]